MDILLVFLSGLLILLVLIVVMQRLHRRRLFPIHYPWVLLVAFSESDKEASARTKELRSRLLSQLNRDYQLSPSSLLELILDTINDTGRCYYPESDEPVRQLSAKQLNSLLNRILGRLQDLFSIYPFTMLAGTNIGALQYVYDTQKSIRENSVVKFISESAVGKYLKSIPFGKIAKGIRLSRKVKTPMGMVIEAGKQLTVEGIKRLVLREVAQVAYRESVRAFSGGEVYENDQRAAMLSLWMAAGVIRKEKPQNGEPLRWFLTEMVELKQRPETLCRYLVLMATGQREKEIALRGEIHARYRQSLRRLNSGLRKPPDSWRRFLALQGGQLSGYESLEKLVIENLNEFASTLPEASPARKAIAGMDTTKD